MENYNLIPSLDYEIIAQLSDRISVARDDVVAGR
jgi:hypothetical protein